VMNCWLIDYLDVVVEAILDVSRITGF
jgi:hypothetical protein